MSLINLQWHEEQKGKKNCIFRLSGLQMLQSCPGKTRYGEKGCLSLRIKKNRYLYIFIIYEMYDRNICANAPKMSRGKKQKKKR